MWRAASFKAENSFVSASHSLLTQADFRRSEDAARVQVAVRIATFVAAPWIMVSGAFSDAVEEGPLIAPLMAIRFPQVVMCR